MSTATIIPERLAELPGMTAVLRVSGGCWHGNHGVCAGTGV